MKLFLDTSVLLAGCNSESGASMAICNMAHRQGWDLLASPWVLEEVARNLRKFPAVATIRWTGLRQKLVVVDDVVSLDCALVFPVSKDRPVLITALAWADVLLTLDSGDFTGMLGASCYGMPILSPSEFLTQERASGRLK